MVGLPLLCRYYNGKQIGTIISIKLLEDFSKKLLELHRQGYLKGLKV
jgi:hypothetical protein